ncbi:hypothetical protein KQI84_08860 [bacterium]|nr:hypothetical protein [bacterium]
MKIRSRFVSRACPLASAILVVLLISAVSAAPESAPFVYQGYLEDAGSPANGTYDLAMTPYLTPNDGSPAADTFYADDTVVSDGVFSVELDFSGKLFEMGDFHVEFAVRPGSVDNGDRDPATYTTLSPRQAFLPTHTSYLARNSMALSGYTASDLRNASLINAGTLNSGRFSAYLDLQDEGRIGASSGQVAAGDHLHTKADLTDLEPISTTPAAGTIPVADASGKLNAAWLPSAPERELPNPSAGSISAGTAVSYYDGSIHEASFEFPAITSSVFGTSTEFEITALDDTHALIAYRDEADGNRGKLRVMTIDGETITLGDPVVFSDDAVQLVQVTALYPHLSSLSRYFVVSYTTVVSGLDLIALGGSVHPDLSIAVGAPLTVSNGIVTEFDLEGSGDNTVTIAFINPHDSNRPTLELLFLSNATLGVLEYSSQVVSTGSSNVVALASISENDVLVAYDNGNNSGKLTVIHASMEIGNNIQIVLGAKKNLNSVPTRIRMAPVGQNLVALAYERSGVSYSYLHCFQVSGDPLVSLTRQTFGTAADLVRVESGVFAAVSQDTDLITTAFDAFEGDIFEGPETTIAAGSGYYSSITSFGGPNILVAYSTGSASVALCRYAKPIGVATQTSTNPVPTLLDGIANAYTGLAPGADYYLEWATGNLTPDRGWVKVGRAVSDTELLLDIE